jgi:hypothetical protein
MKRLKLQNWLLVSGNCMKQHILRFFCLITLCLPVLANQQEITRLNKGELQYHYLTGDYTSALQRLAQLKKDGDIADSETDFMQATMLLALGLQSDAQTLFEKTQNIKNITSSNSWFELAKYWFELAEFESVIDSIDQIKITAEQSAEFGIDKIAEAQFMKATAYIALGQHRKAQELIAKMDKNSIWTGYARHNHILAMFEGNNSGRSLPLLIQEAIFYMPKTDEGSHVRDRINLIAALHYSAVGMQRAVEKHLKAINLDGPYTPPALLQLGWNYVEQERYSLALQPWRELQTRFNSFEPDVMESMLGVPHVLEQMEANTQALKTLESVEEKFSAMKQAVLSANNSHDINIWLSNWIAKQSNKTWGSRATLDVTFSMTETTSFLRGLVSAPDFINHLVDYRDQVLLSEYLTEKEQSLQLWLSLVEKRQQQSKVDEATIKLNMAATQLASAKQQLTNLEDYLSQSYIDLFSLPNSLEQKKITAVSRTAKAIERLAQENKANRDLDPYKQRWRRVRGVFLWQMHENKPQKQWQLQKELSVMDAYIQRTETQLLETRLAKQWSPIAWQGMKARIEVLLEKTSQLKALANANQETQRQWLTTSAITYLDKLTIRINDYLAQSRLSIARLYDDALQRYVAAQDNAEQEQ